MNRIRAIRILSIITFLFILISFAGCTESKEVQKFISDFESLSIGDTEAKILSILGNPNSKETEFRVGQKIGFESLYKKASQSNSEYYLIWERGIDLVFCIGIGKDKTVKIKEYTGT